MLLSLFSNNSRTTNFIAENFIIIFTFFFVFGVFCLNIFPGTWSDKLRTYFQNGKFIRSFGSLERTRSRSCTVKSLTATFSRVQKCGNRRLFHWIVWKSVQQAVENRPIATEREKNDQIWLVNSLRLAISTANPALSFTGRSLFTVSLPSRLQVMHHKYHTSKGQWSPFSVRDIMRNKIATRLPGEIANTRELHGCYPARGWIFF